MPVQPVTGLLPVDFQDYAISMESSVNGKTEKKIIKRGVVAEDFLLIAPDVKISDPAESFVVNFVDDSLDISLIGSSEHYYNPNFEPLSNVFFRVMNNTSLDLNGLPVSSGRVYLKDGRVLSLDALSQPMPAYKQSIYSFYLGSAKPDKDFPATPAQYLNSKFDFDLEGAVLLFAYSEQWKAWDLPDARELNVP